MSEAVLSPNADRILAHLQGQWTDRLRLTTVAQAQAALGLSLDADVRRSLGSYLLAHPEFHASVARWGAPAFALTEDEKLLGRYLTARAGGDSGRCTPDETAAALDRSRADIEAGLRALAALGLLAWEEDAGGVSYRLALDLGQRLGPLGWTFHTVEVTGEGRFNVPCAVDFLLLVRSDYAHHRVTIDDACAHCTERIRVVIDHARIVTVEPPEAVLLYGGG